MSEPRLVEKKQFLQAWIIVGPNWQKDAPHL
jgi:hypothetical protein